MGVRRTELAFEGQFVQIPNAWVRDRNLSRRARGLLAEIMSHRVGWHVTTRTLAGSGPEGRDAVRTALAELVEHGYLRRAQGRGEGGTFEEIEYELSEPTVAGFSGHGEETPDQTVAGFTVAGSTVDGESATKNTITQEDHQVELLSAVADAAPSRLDELWALWPAPRRSTRKVVEQKLRAALKVAQWDDIITAAAAHVAVWETWSELDRRQFVPLLSTWLHQERWTAAPPQPRVSQLSGVDMGRAADAILSGLGAVS